MGSVYDQLAKEMHEEDYLSPKQDLHQQMPVTRRDSILYPNNINDNGIPRSKAMIKRSRNY
jgi:hypothetical protein